MSVVCAFLWLLLLLILHPALSRRDFSLPQSETNDTGMEINGTAIDNWTRFLNTFYRRSGPKANDVLAQPELVLNQSEPPAKDISSESIAPPNKSDGLPVQAYDTVKANGSGDNVISAQAISTLPPDVLALKAHRFGGRVDDVAEGRNKTESLNSSNASAVLSQVETSSRPAHLVESIRERTEGKKGSGGESSRIVNDSIYAVLLLFLPSRSMAFMLIFCIMAIAFSLRMHKKGSVHQQCTCRECMEGVMRSRRLQGLVIAFLSFQFVTHMAIVPDSFDLMTDANYTAIHSGFLISCSFPLEAFGSLFARWKVSTWTQQRVMTLAIFFGLMLVQWLIAVVADPPSWLGQIENLRFRALLTLRLVDGFLTGVINQTFVVDIVKLTPKSELTAFQMLNVSSKTLGIGMGPLFSSLVVWASGVQGCRGRVAATYYILSSFWLILATSAWAIMPIDIEPLQRRKAAADLVEVTKASEGACSSAFSELPEHSQHHVWFGAIMYAVEIAFMTGLLEAATAVILEHEFGFDMQVGFLIGGITLLGCPVILVSEAIRRGLKISETAITMFTATISVLCCFCFFPFSGKTKACVAVHSFHMVIKTLVEKNKEK